MIVIERRDGLDILQTHASALVLTIFASDEKSCPAEFKLTTAYVFSSCSTSNQGEVAAGGFRCDALDSGHRRGEKCSKESTVLSWLGRRSNVKFADIDGVGNTVQSLCDKKLALFWGWMDTFGSVNLSGVPLIPLRVPSKIKSGPCFLNSHPPAGPALLSLAQHNARSVH